MTTTTTISLPVAANDPKDPAVAAILRTIRVSVEHITPETAAAYLEVNQDNRKVRDAVVGQYSRDMDLGNWAFTGQPVIFDRDGLLIDGQHRLMSCVRSGKPFVTLVVRGIVRGHRADIDTGAKRLLHDVLKWHGEKNCAALAAAIRTEILWSNGYLGGGKSRKVSNSEALAWLDLNPGLREATTTALTVSHSSLKVPMSVAAPFIHQVTMQSPPDALAFAHAIATGENLQPNSPPLLLRNWATNQAKIAHSQPTSTMWLALMVKAWNAWITGDPVKILRWRRGGASAEAFPEMVDQDGQVWPILPELERTAAPTPGGTTAAG